MPAARTDYPQISKSGRLIAVLVVANGVFNAGKPSLLGGEREETKATPGTRVSEPLR
jgi:hypothetical protein